MASLIPENLSSRRDVPAAASRLAKALREALDDDATVWFEPLFGAGRERPDLVALVPDTGILVLEILGAKNGALRGMRDGGLVVVDRNDNEHVVPTPLARAEAFASDLAERIASAPALGPSDCLAVTAGGVFAYVSRSDPVRAGPSYAQSASRAARRPELLASRSSPERERRGGLPQPGPPGGRHFSCDDRELAAGEAICEEHLLTGPPACAYDPRVQRGPGE